MCANAVPVLRQCLTLLPGLDAVRMRRAVLRLCLPEGWSTPASNPVEAVQAGGPTPGQQAEVAMTLLRQLLGRHGAQDGAAESLAAFVSAHASTLARLLRPKEQTNEVCHELFPTLRSRFSCIMRSVLSACRFADSFILERRAQWKK